MQSIVLPKLQFVTLSEKNLADVVKFFEPNDVEEQFSLTLHLISRIEAAREKKQYVTLELGTFGRQREKDKELSKAARDYVLGNDVG